MDGSLKEAKETHMVKSDFRLRSMLIAFSLFCSLPSLTYAKGGLVSNKQITASIEEVRTGKTTNIRTNAAQRLAELTRGINPDKVNDKTLADLVALFGTSEDSVRFWVAASLGNLGPRARAAAPKLLDLLPQVDCLRGELTSAPAIRLALERIGVTPPPEDLRNCK